MKKLYFLFSILITLTVLALSPACTKEGPAGKDGKDGVNGADGNDGTAGCIECHSPDVVELAATQFQLSKHEYGEAAFEEAGNTTCTPCHAQEAFKYVVENNIPSTFSLNETTNKYVNNYVTIPTAAYGDIGCSACHSSLHTTYANPGDFALTTVAPVSLTMWAGAKTADCQADGGKSNLCIKCHQPRPFTTSSTLSNGNVVDYANLIANPNAIYYDSAVGNAAPNKHLPSYRFHIHYGAVGAVFAGVGGIEFGTGYSNTIHTTIASCQDCHMATITGRAGGHTFTAKGNFNGCNTADCHGENGVNAQSAAYWTEPRANIKSLLDQLADHINAIGNGTPILHSDNSESNLWAGLTTGNWDGYLNIYDASANPDGYWRNPGNNSAPNLAKPKFPSLTNAQVGAMINFQLALRDYSLGIHNFNYTYTLLNNSIAVLGGDLAVK